MSIRIAAVQMTSTQNKEQNIKQAENYIRRARSLGADFVCLPENFSSLGQNDQENLHYAEDLTGPTVSYMCNLAQELQIWLSLGGMQIKTPDSHKIFNSHIVINNSGKVINIYNKIFLFSVNLPDGSSYNEAQIVKPGSNPVCFYGPGFIGGLSICYDIRFSNLFSCMRAMGAQVIFVPAAFTDTTGKAHWEILLRARAIETQCYIIAAAQSGRHNPKRKTHGHTMIIDPWGVILAQCGQSSNLAIAEIDLEYTNKIRAGMPILQHWKKLEPQQI